LNLYEVEAFKYFSVLILYLVLLLISFSASDKNRKIVIAAASLIFSVILFGKPVFLLYIAAYLFYRLLYSRFKASFKVILAILFYLFFIVFYLKILNGIFNIPLTYLYIFGAIFALRFVLFFYHNFLFNFKKEPFLDYLLYIFFPPYFIIQPHILILPKYEYFKNSFTDKENLPLVAKSGIKYLLSGLVLLLTAWAINYILFFFKIDISERSGGVVNFFRTCTLFLGIWGYSIFLLGLIRGLGYNIKSPIRKPYLAVDFADFFSRSFVYYVEFLTSLFYLPALILTKNINKYLSILVSAVIAIFLGDIFNVTLSLGIRFCDIVGRILNVRLLTADQMIKIFDFDLWRLFLIGFLFGIHLAWKQMANSTENKLWLVRRADKNILVKALKIMIMFGAIIYVYN